MNRKGFTLVELIVTIGLLAVIGVSLGISLNRSIKKQNDLTYQEYVERIKSSANLYVSNKGKIISDLKTKKGYEIINIIDIMNEGYLSKNVINPKTKEEAKNEKVKVLLDANGTIKIEYPLKAITEDYLQTIDIIVEYGKEGSENYCYNGINTASLAYIKKDGTMVQNLAKGENIKCKEPNIDTKIIGTYELKYEYLNQTTNKWKQASRKVIVADHTKPIVSLTSSIEGWTNQNVTLIGTATDSGSGIEYYYFSTEPNLTTLNNIKEKQKFHEESDEVTTEIKTQQNSKYYLYVQDKAGNISRSEGVLVQIDKTAPSKPSMCYVDVNWNKYNNGTETTKALYAVCEKNENPLKYIGPYGSHDNFTKDSDIKYKISIDNNNWEDYKYNIEDSVYRLTEASDEQQVRYFKACDQAENCSAVLTMTVKIILPAPSEKPNAPTIKASDGILSGRWHKNNTTLNFSGSRVSNGSVVYYYGTNQNSLSKTGTTTGSITTEGSTTYYVKACNSADLSKCSSIVKYELKIDKTAPSVPTVELRYSDKNGDKRNTDTKWTNQNLWLGNLQSTDNTGGSGIDHYEYFGGGQYYTLNDPQTGITFMQEQNTPIQVIAVDKAGNRRVNESVYYIKIDKTKPSVPTAEFRYGDKNGNKRNHANTWTNQNLWLGNLQSTDNTGGSGIDHYEYYDSETKKYNTLSDPQTGITFGQEQNKTIQIIAVDKAGNRRVNDNAYHNNIDKHKPTCTAVKNSSSTLFANGVPVKMTCSDTGGSGCKTSTTTETLKATKTYTVYDNAGNTNTCMIKIGSRSCNCSTCGGDCASYSTICQCYKCNSLDGANCSVVSSCDGERYCSCNYNCETTCSYYNPTYSCNCSTCYYQGS